ncbi:MAG: chemotaxis protein CheD, partial [Elusimicrobia bacterium]|nr:chemotaxis protein CheD [Elusimicrobiota bacterium]
LSADPADVLITYALGSCVGVAIYDPVARVGGLLHAQLPEAGLCPEKAALAPGLFMDAGLPLLFRGAYALGAQKGRIVVAAAGGGCPTARDGRDFFQIGARNVVVLRRLLWRNAVLLRAEDLGGFASRTMSLSLADGEVAVKSEGVLRVLVPPAPRPAGLPWS